MGNVEKFGRLCQRHNIQITPHKRESAQCGEMRASEWHACRMHATICKLFTTFALYK